MKRSLFLSLLCLALAACGKQQHVPQSESATSGHFQLVADEVLKPAVDSLVAGFMQENPDVTISVKYTSATEAVRELLNHQARAILIDRGLTPIERGILAKDSIQLPAFKLALDGIGVLVSQKNPLDAIAKSDLVRIMSGKIANWSGLVRPVPDKANAGRKIAGEITVALPAYPSSIEFALDSILLADSGTTAAHVFRFSTSDSIIGYVRQNPNAIGFISSAWYHELTASNDTSVKALPVEPADLSSEGLIEPVLLNMAYVAEGLYPLATPVTAYSFDVPDTPPRGFLAYAATAHGQIVFKNFDVLPTTQPIRIVKSQ